MKKPNTDSPLMSQDDHTVYQVRIALLDPNLSPKLLREATNLDIDTCITICSQMLANGVFGFEKE
jgi:hypothetical protein